MLDTIFTPHHMTATQADFTGNNGIGRYILLPGSDGRAQQITQYFDNVAIRHHPRGHNVYLGTLNSKGYKIDVATVASGMGCPSTEIIVHELFHLGAKRFLRIGTAGTLQPTLTRIGDTINVQATVRDEDTTRGYAPIEFPALASLEYISACLLAAEHLKLSERIHTGIVHCKSSLYARELAAGPRAAKNQAYMHLLNEMGVLATEMETAALFIQSQLYNYQLTQQGPAPQNRVLAGAILAIIGTIDHLEDSPEARAGLNNSIEIALETIKILAAQELTS